MRRQMMAIFMTGMMAASGLSARELKVSATIDFLDCSFTYNGQESHYPLDVYEKHIHTLAEAGVKKIYLRVNICGLTHYPSGVSAEYGFGGAFHWSYPKAARRLIETYRHYNPCVETIRLGHKYGMEVWGWESLYDDAGLGYGRQGVTEEDLPAYNRLGGWALMDPWYVDNMDALAAHVDNQKHPQEEIDRINQKARQKTIAKIIFANTEKWGNLAPCHATHENLHIYVSQDNASYVEYTKPFTFTASTDPARRNEFILSGLEIHAPYVKLFCENNQNTKDEDITLVLAAHEGQARVEDKDGNLIPSCWTFCAGPLETAGLDFTKGVPAGWDCMGRHVGFVVGTANTQGVFHYGIAEFAVPKAMEHKVARFAEITSYPFDGFMFNTRCHSAYGNGCDYGYNPEVLAKFKDRFGRDFAAGKEEDVAGVFQIRAEAIAEFFRRCKALSGGRPIYFSAPKPPEMRDDWDYNDTFGPMPWPYRQMFAEGSIDGVMMIGRNFRNGSDFSRYFTPELTGGRDVKIGIFREMGDDCPKDYDFAGEMDCFRREGRLDEIELYESLRFELTPDVSKVIHNQVPADYKIDFIWKLAAE